MQPASHSSDGANGKSSLYDRLATAFVWFLVCGITAFMSLGLMWVSHVPQAGVLAIFGDQAPATLGEPQRVRYGSFPYDGIIRVVEYQTPGGNRYYIERTGDYVPPGFSENLSIHYLPLFPRIALIDKERRVRYWIFLAGIFCILVFCLSLSLSPEARRRNFLCLRPFLAVGNLILNMLERRFEQKTQ